VPGVAAAGVCRLASRADLAQLARKPALPGPPGPPGLLLTLGDRTGLHADGAVEASGMAAGAQCGAARCSKKSRGLLQNIYYDTAFDDVDSAPAKIS
jgi:hypothetical protein